MQLSATRPPFIIPSYSLTGDLLAYLACGLQYRYQNMAALPPSKPVQLWFGEFIHAVMEESYRGWASGALPRTFPWDWATVIRPIELSIATRLLARNLVPPFNLFCGEGVGRMPCSCPGNLTNHKLLASERTDALINTWGPFLFPLIAAPEVPLSGIRPMPIGNGRAPFYEITGKADVLGSVQITAAPRGNLILHYLYQNRAIQNAIANAPGGRFEIILDYKGMRRPSLTAPSWRYYQWQVQTYAWLRQQQDGSAPVVAGIILYVDELEPSQTEFRDLWQDVTSTMANPSVPLTDVMPSGWDLREIQNWQPGTPMPILSSNFREQRSISVVPISQSSIDQSLREFDTVVSDIEGCVLQEMTGQGIVAPWRQRPSGDPYFAPERRTCTACDFKHQCPLAPQVGEGGPPTAP